MTGNFVFSTKTAFNYAALEARGCHTNLIEWTNNVVKILARLSEAGIVS